MMNRNELARAIYDCAHLTGEFLLRSGQTSKEYFDKYQFEARPELLKEIAKQLAPLVPPETEILAGLEMGGIPVATALSFELNRPVVFVRKEAKGYGTRRLAEGPSISGKKVCIVEDVITTGGQVVLSAQDLRQEGAQLVGVVCVIDRSQGQKNKVLESGLPMKSLFTAEELRPV